MSDWKLNSIFPPALSQEFMIKISNFIFDGDNLIIQIKTGVTSVSVRDLWSRWVDWYLTEDNSKYLPAFTCVGGDIIDDTEGTFIPIYAFLMNGWKIRPQNSAHTLTIKDGILLVNGGGDPFVDTEGAYTVRIRYSQPVQAISFSTEGGGSTAPTVEEIRQEIDTNSIKLQQILTDISDIEAELTPEQATQLDELHKLQGLDTDNPMTVTASVRTAGDIVLHIAGDGENISIVTRE